MKKALKLLHTLGAIGLTGALIVHLMLLAQLPHLETLAEQAALRESIATVARWLLLPSLTVVLACGLLSLAAHPPFREARWVWMKALLGLSVFEGTLVSIQGPAVRNAELTARALSGELDPARLAGMMHSEWGALWVILTVAVANVVLGVLRPSLRRRRRATAAETQS
ncbi:MAG: hypothetical protein RIC56_09440 [Pseudomonadales bacterium]